MNGGQDQRHVSSGRRVRGRGLCVSRSFSVWRAENIGTWAAAREHEPGAAMAAETARGASLSSRQSPQ
jgi:hypothetical protein